MHIETIPAFNPGPLTGAGNNTYLVGDRECVLIDAGTGDARHLDGVAAALERSGARLAHVIVTHAHVDHIEGAVAIAARWPGATFSKVPWPDRDGRFGVPWHPLADGGTVTAGEVALRVVHTPGHSPDHACFWEPNDRTLFGGDLVTPGTTVVIPGTRGGDLVAYLASLTRVRAMNPHLLLPAHGAAVTNPTALINAYLAHRRERDEQIVDAVRAGCANVDAIVARVYPSIDENLRWAAVETVSAHLTKLATERRVNQRADGWTATDV